MVDWAGPALGRPLIGIQTAACCIKTRHDMHKAFKGWIRCTGPSVGLSAVWIRNTLCEVNGEFH